MKIVLKERIVGAVLIGIKRLERIHINLLQTRIQTQLLKLLNTSLSDCFLSAVANCRTQNVNESFHHLVWQLAPKETYTSTNETKCALFLAVSLFSDGYASSLGNICELARIKVYENMKNQWSKFDSVKLYHKICKKMKKLKRHVRNVRDRT